MLRYFIFTQLCKHGSLINALIILFVTSYYVLYNIVQIQYKYATLLKCEKLPDCNYSI